MPSLQVRELPEPLYGALQKKAKQEHRSLAQQAVMTLARGMGMDVDACERRRALLKNLQTDPVCPVGTSLPGAATLVKEDRER